MILRVFPKQTSFTPDDDMVKIGMPDMFIPEHDENMIEGADWD